MPDIDIEFIGKLVHSKIVGYNNSWANLCKG